MSQQQSTMINHTAEEFEKVLEEYNTCRLNFEALPKAKVEKGKKFDNKGYQTSEAARVRMDIALANLVLLKQEQVKFLYVQREQGVVMMLYNPFGDYLDELKEMTYVEQDVSDKKTRAYTNAAKDSIMWRIRVMNGDINDLFNYKLAVWFTEKDYKSELEDFCKAVAIIIRYYPHVDMQMNEDYMTAFFEWFSEHEKDEIVLMNVYDGIMEQLKMCFFANVREGFEKEGTLADEIRMHKPELKIQDCSKKCHDAFAKLRIGSEKKKNFLDSIKQKGMDKKASIAARFKTSKPAAAAAPVQTLPAKRKIDEVDGEKPEEPARKKTREESSEEFNKLLEDAEKAVNAENGF